MVPPVNDHHQTLDVVKNVLRDLLKISKPLMLWVQQVSLLLFKILEKTLLKFDRNLIQTFHDDVLIRQDKLFVALELLRFFMVTGNRLHFDHFLFGFWGFNVTSDAHVEAFVCDLMSFDQKGMEVGEALEVLGV
jgi:hypothetical protein